MFVQYILVLGGSLAWPCNLTSTGMPIVYRWASAYKSIQLWYNQEIMKINVGEMKRQLSRRETDAGYRSGPKAGDILEPKYTFVR